jgi:predicted aspartyl protease
MPNRSCQPLVAACLILGAVLKQPGAPKTAVEDLVLPLESVHGSLIAVRGSIANLERLRFLIDTGTYRTLIAERIARNLQLRSSNNATLTIFGQAQLAEPVTLSHLQVGPIRRENFPVLAAELSSRVGTLGWQLDGILGLDLLRGHCLVLDYRTRQLIFGCQTGWSTSVPLDAQSPYLLVPVKIDEHDYRLLVDTGADVIALYERAGAGHADTLESTSYSADTLAGTVQLNRFTATRFWIGLTLLQRQPVYVVRRPQPNLGHDGILGPANLAQRIQLDLKAMVISW